MACKKKAVAHILCGIEIEMAHKNIGISGGGYHNSSAPKFGKHFFAESDSSISSGTEYSSTSEIISTPFKMSNWRQMTRAFRNEVKRRVDLNGVGFFETKELKDFIGFNRTTGCHIHIDLGVTDKGNKEQVTYKNETHSFKRRTLNLKQLASYDVLMNIKNTIDQRVKDELPAVYGRKWKETFNDRGYAKDSRKNKKLNKSERGVDWNFRGSSNRTIEFRAFTLCGVKTWAEFNKLFSIAFTTIGRIFNDELNKDRGFESVKHIEYDTDFVSHSEVEYEIICKPGKKN